MPARAGRDVRPCRPQVLDAITQAHRSGIGIHVVTGDDGTAAEIAHRVGIGSAGIRIVTGEQLDALNDPELDSLLSPLVEQSLDSETSMTG